MNLKRRMQRQLDQQRLKAVRKKLSTPEGRAEIEAKKIPILENLGPHAEKFPNIPVSVCIIARDCAESLQRTLHSLRLRFVLPCDEIVVVDTGSQDNNATVRVAEKYGCTVIQRPDLKKDYRPYVEKWCPELLPVLDKTQYKDGGLLDFSEPRQIAQDAAQHDVQFWIDTDDTLEEKVQCHLRATVNQCFSDPKYIQIFMNYLYSRDREDGSVTSVLKRERIYHRAFTQWKGRCHETNIPIDEVAQGKQGMYYQDLQSVIEHHKVPEKDWKDINPSDLRNYVILKREFEENTEKPDPRTIFYLANAARGIHHNDEAIALYERFIPLSGSRDDRYAAAYYMGSLYCGPELRRPIDGMRHYMRCLTLKPEDPRGYFGMARAYFMLGNFQASMHWYNCGKNLPEPAQCMHTYDPRHIHVLPLQIAALCCEKLNDEGGVKHFVGELIKVAPNHPETVSIKDNLGNWLAGRELIQSIDTVVRNTGIKNPMERVKVGRKLVEHLACVPSELEKAGLAKAEPPDEREGEDLVIYCGPASEPWGPKTGETGIGGSEKAVVQMAPRLQKRGFRVTVYTDTPLDQRGIDKDTGVNWQHFGSFDWDRPRGTVIFWRAPEALEAPIKCTKRILWCHDVQDPGRWTPQRIALADQVWVLSEYHASTLGPVRKELGNRLIITRNGLDTELYKKHFGTVERDMYKVIFMSSPDRGIMTSIQIFNKAQELARKKRGDEFADRMSLHLFYGFTKLFMDNANRFEYFHVPDVNYTKNAFEYLDSVIHAIDKSPNIHMRGRVGWEEMAKEQCSAGAWLYPTRFWEISCMAAMEAQAAGCVPVASQEAALKETIFCGDDFVQNPDDIEGSAWKLLLAIGSHWSLNGFRENIHKQACDRFCYEKLADEWADLLRKDTDD